MPDPIPALPPTTVVGSFSVPGRLEHARERHRTGALTDAELDEAHDTAVPSCLKDQELACAVLVNADDRTTPGPVAVKSRRALTRIPAERLWVNPDCGLKFTQRAGAAAKLQAMITGTAIVRRAMAGSGR